MTTPKSGFARQINSKLSSSQGVSFSSSSRFDPALDKELTTPSGKCVPQSPTWNLQGAVSSLGKQSMSKSRSESSFSISGGQRHFPFRGNGPPKGLKPENETVGDTGLGPMSPCFTSFGKQPSSKRHSPHYAVMVSSHARFLWSSFCAPQIIAFPFP